MGVRIPVQDYRSLYVVVMICATLVNTQTHTHRQLLNGIQLAEQAINAGYATLYTGRPRLSRGRSVCMEHSA